MKTISFLSLGCRANQAEIAEYHQGMLEAGWEVLDPSLNSSSVYVINTCTVTNDAERQSRQLIRRVSRHNPDANIVVTGCSTSYIQKNKDIVPLVNLFVPNLSKDKLVSRLYTHLGIEKDFDHLDTIPPVEDSETTRLNIKISDGCNWACSYCIIPRVRGKLRSLSVEDVIAKAKKAEEMGYKEIVLTAIQLGGYGKDFGAKGLEILIPKLLSETNIPRIRLSSIEPTDVSDKLIEELAKSPRICNHFHIPIQHGSTKILDLMKRKYTQEDYEVLINKIRKAIPDVTITTDVIVGFPNETAEDFSESYDFIKKIAFNKLHIFPYSDRNGTAASKMNDKVTPQIIKVRKKQLAELGDQQYLEWLNNSLGETKEILIENVMKFSNIRKGTSRDYLKIALDDSIYHKNDIVKVKIDQVNSENMTLVGVAV